MIKIVFTFNNSYGGEYLKGINLSFFIKFPFSQALHIPILIPVILTDNGSEFKNPEGLELDSLGNQRTKIFYCNPMASYQKPHIEKNHEYIRYLIPKGKSFDNRTQEDIILMINHINSTARASLNGNTPFKLAQMLLDSSLLDKLSLKRIGLDDVHLKPALFKK